jgi:hypothetical protein
MTDTTSNIKIQSIPAVDQSQIERIKSAMVLYEIERSLGNFVCAEVSDISALPKKTLKNIEARGNYSG